MEKVQIDKEALEHIITNGRGPCSRQQDGATVPGYWHKENHHGPETCAGCAVEVALAGGAS
jgi:hypothetical protein